jgi:hypothetical protein
LDLDVKKNPASLNYHWHPAGHLISRSAEASIAEQAFPRMQAPATTHFRMLKYWLLNPKNYTVPH